MKRKTFQSEAQTERMTTGKNIVHDSIKQMHFSMSGMFLKLHYSKQFIHSLFVDDMDDVYDYWCRLSPRLHPLT